MQKVLQSKKGWKIRRFIDDLSPEHFAILDSGGMSIKYSQILIQKASARLLYTMISKKFLAENSLKLDKMLPILNWYNQASLSYLVIYLRLLLIPGFKNNQLNIGDLRYGQLKCLYMNPKLMMRVNTLAELELINLHLMQLNNFIYNMIAPCISIFYLISTINSQIGCDSNAIIIADMVLSLPQVSKSRLITTAFIIPKCILCLLQAIGVIRQSVIEAIMPYWMLMVSILLICNEGRKFYLDIKHMNDALPFQNDFIEQEKKIRPMLVNAIDPESILKDLKSNRTLCPDWTLLF